MKLLNLETLHATVTCRHGLELKANFGARPFVYDVAQYYRQRSLSEKSTKKLTFSVVSKSKFNNNSVVLISDSEIPPFQRFSDFLLTFLQC